MYDYIPTGILVFKTKMYGTREFRDGSLKIEDKIDEIIDYYDSKTLEEMNWKIKRSRNQRKKEIVRWFDLKRQRKVMEELKRIKELLFIIHSLKQRPELLERLLPLPQFCLRWQGNDERLVFVE